MERGHSGSHVGDGSIGLTPVCRLRKWVTEVIAIAFWAHFGGMNNPLSYGFWYSYDWETVDSASATASANLYNEKSSKPHLKQ